MKKTILTLAAAALLAVSAVPAQAAERHYLLEDCSKAEDVRECRQAKVLPSIILGTILGGAVGAGVFGALGGTLAAGSTVAVGTASVTLPAAVATGAVTGGVVGGGASLLAD